MVGTAILPENQKIFSTQELKEKGIPVDTDVTTVDEAKRSILKVFGIDKG